MTAPQQPMLGRRQLRLAIVAAIEKIKSTVGIVTIDSPGDVNTPPEKLPAVLIRIGRDSKESIKRGMAEFTTSSTVEIEGRIGAATSSAAQDDIEALGFAVENCVLTDFNVMGMVNQASSVDTETEITSDGKVHFGGFKMHITFEYPEMYDPTAAMPALTTWPVVPPATVPLTMVTLDADLTNVVDQTGTYANPLFPQAVTPAPRTTGPDGRTEGGLDIPLPQ